MDVPIFNIENILFHYRRGYFRGSNQKIIVIIVNMGNAGMQGFFIALGYHGFQGRWAVNSGQKGAVVNLRGARTV
jgi:hypothetical protein